MELQHRRALVLGGSAGIGLAAAQDLEAKGARVAVASRSARSRERARDGLSAETERFDVDVRDRAALTDLFASLAPLDVLVCAATGGERATGPFLEMDLDGFQGSFDKLWGYTNAVRLAGPHLSEEAAIVLVSGFPARKSPPGFSAIATVGNAVEGFARAIAPEIAPRRINVVSPGTIVTEMFGTDLEEVERRLAGTTANNLIPRPGTAKEVSQAILFAIENDFVTGTTIDVDGGALLP